MNVEKNPGRIHPILAAAAASVILVSLIGVAAMTGILPTSWSHNASDTTVQVPENEAAASTDTVKDAAKEVPSEKPAAAAPVKPTHVAQAKHSQPVRTHTRAPEQMIAAAPRICEDCGRIEEVNAIKQQPKGSGVGAVAGVLLGGALGNQVGSGNGRKLATVAGAVGGGFAGNAVEKNMHTTTTYEVRVRMDDGSMRSFSYATPPAFGPGAPVRVVNGNLVSQG